jgi:hypothetical protein
MAFKFYLDGQLTDQPMNDKELSTTIKRNSSLGALLITQDVDLEYNGNNLPEPGAISGYSYLKLKFDTGSCQEVSITITDELSNYQTLTVYVGVIKVPSLRFDLHKAMLKCKVQDNNFYAYLNNNKSIKYNIQSNTTKSGLTIVPPPIYDVDVFNGEDGVYLSTINEYARGYRVYDVFAYIIAAISDNKVGFYSNFLQQDPQIFIFDGFALANKNTDPNVSVSFNDLYNELKLIYNISFYIDYADLNNPVLILERNSDLYSGVNEVEFLDIKELESSIKSDNLYGSVRVGASNNPGGADQVYTLPSGTSYFAYGEEVFTPRGQCNLDNELALVNRFHIANNDVNNQINGGSSEFYDELFLIQCDTVNTTNRTATAVAFAPWAAVNPSTPNAVFYNFGFININKVNNYGNSIQSAIFNTQTLGSDAFQAQNSQEFVLVSTDPQYTSNYLETGNPDIVFSDVSSPGNFNGNGNYNIIFGEYTVPADGAYSFSANYTLDVNNLKQCLTNFFVTSNNPGLPTGNYANILVQDVIYVTAKITVYDALLTFVSESSQLVKIVNNSDTHQVSVSYPVNVEATDIVKFSLSGKIYKQVVPTNSQLLVATFPIGFSPQTIEPLHPDFGNTLSGNNYFTWFWPTCNASPFITSFVTLQSFIRTDGTPDSGITIAVNQEATFDNYEYNFVYDISQTDWFKITGNPTSLFLFEKDGIDRYGWIDTMKRNDWTGMTNIKLITNNAVTTQ